MVNKIIYRALCKTETTIPLFSQAWWLDAVVGEANWDVILHEKGNNVIASLPYVINKKVFLKFISMPLLTQTAGVWIKYPAGQKYVSKLSFEKDVIYELIRKIPTVDHFSQNFHYNFNNWLPFYWSGYKQTTKYTYVLEDLSDINYIFMNLKDNIRREIRKAKKIVEISSSDSIAEFYKVNKLTFERQDLNIPYTLEYINNIDKACEEQNCRKIFLAKDSDGNIHGAIYIVWDSDSSYYLMGGGDPKYRNSGATSLLMWEAIKFSAEVTNKFDFEGSMMQPIERFFSAFGATQKPYFKISKTNSKLLKVRNFLIEVLK